MNTTPPPPAFRPARRATPASRSITALGALALCVGLTGCFGFLKPAESTTRNYILTPVASPSQAPTGGAAMSLGVGRVRLPAYLFNSSLAVRRGTNEVEYLPAARWAERLDTSFQRVLGANLAALVPADQIRLSSWNRQDIAAEVHVIIEQFDVDAAGHGVLTAGWRILPPGGGKPLQSGTARLIRDGPSPDDDPSGAVTTLSQLLSDFSQQLTESIRATVPPPATGGAN